MIRSVVFDVGNVFVRWSPAEIIRRTFELPPGSAESQRLVAAIFRSPIWTALNRGELTQDEAAASYRRELGLDEERTRRLFFHVVDHQEPIEGTEPLARRLREAGYRVFGLTDNVREIVAALRARYAFWDVLEGVVVSAEVGVVKPDPRIFRHLLARFALAAEETVFLDDHPPNVEGARAVGLEARVFETAARAAEDLRALGLELEE
jgi:putative hydrolase of the HAD superfamily